MHAKAASRCFRSPLAKTCTVTVIKALIYDLLHISKAREHLALSILFDPTPPPSAELMTHASAPQHTRWLLDILHACHLLQLRTRTLEDDDLVRLLQSDSEEGSLFLTFRRRRQSEMSRPSSTEILECGRFSGDDLAVVLELEDGENIGLAFGETVVGRAVGDKEELAVGRDDELGASPVAFGRLLLRQEGDVALADCFELEMIVF